MFAGGYAAPPPGYMNQGPPQQGQGGMNMPMPPPMPRMMPHDQGEDGEPKYETGAMAFNDRSIRQGFIRKVGCSLFICETVLIKKYLLIILTLLSVI